MFEFYWTPLSVNFLVSALLSGMLAVFFFLQLLEARRALRKTGIIRILFSVFLFSALSACFQCLSVLLHPDYVDFFLPWVSVFGAGSIAGFVLFAFYLQRPDAGRSWFEYTLWACLSVMVLAELFVAVLRVRSLQDGYVEFREAFLDLPSSLFFLLVVGMFFSKLCLCLALERETSWLRALPYSFLVLFMPLRRLSHDVAMLRAFLYVTLLLITFGLLQLLRSYGFWDWSLVEVASSWLMLVVFSGFALAYLNYIPELSSFLIKLTGTTLTVVLMILVGMVWLIGPTYQAAYQDDEQLTSGLAIHFEPNRDGSYLATRTQFYVTPELGVQVQSGRPVPLAFDFPYFGEMYTHVFPRLSGKVGLLDVPIWRDIQHRFGPHPALFLVTAELKPKQVPQSGLFVNSTPGEMVLTWNRLAGYDPEGGEYTFQLRLYPTGAIEMVFVDIPRVLTPDLRRANAVPMMTGIVPQWEGRSVKMVNFSGGLPLAGGPSQGLMQNHRVAFLKYLDRIYEPVAWFILATSLATVFFLPRFLQVNLNGPLQDMMQGVRRVMGGNLKSSIRISHRDEIGYLAAAFNDMSRAQRDLIETLEQKVKSRTSEAVELAERNARLEERHHLTRELHDSVSQTLYSANLVADQLPAKFQTDPEQGAAELLVLKERNRQALQELRELFEQLRPDLVKPQEFGQLINNVVDRFRSQYDFDISVVIEGDTALPHEVQMTFFRMLQESLNNIAKHAGATEVNVSFDGMQTQAMLEIRDNGCGFDPSAVSPGSLGLQFMKERLDSIGAILELSSASGVGTTIVGIWMTHDK